MKRLYVLYVSELHAVQTILLTCDLPNCAKYIKFFWVQSLNIMIDIPVNDNGRLEQHRKNKMLASDNA